MEQKPVTLDEIKELLEENIEATEENTKLLKAMRRDALIGGIVKTVLWIVLIVASFYFSAKFLEPYLGMMPTGQGGGETQDFGALLKEYQGLLGY